MVHSYRLRDWRPVLASYPFHSSGYPNLVGGCVRAIIVAALANTVAVPGGQPIGLLFELIMGTKAGGFGIVSIFLDVTHRF